MPENKSIDGIKKLSKDEVKKARKILLDYIGEDTEKKVEDSSKPKNMDGILGGINFKKRAKRQKKELEKKENTKKEKEALKKELGFVNKQKEEKVKTDENIGDTFLRMAEKSEKKKKKNKLKKQSKEAINEGKKALKKLESKPAKSSFGAAGELLRRDSKEKIKRELEREKRRIVEEKELKEKEAKKTLKIKEELAKEKKHLEKVKKEEAEKRKREKEEKMIEEKNKNEKEKKERKKRIKKKIKLFKHRIHKKIITFLIAISKMRKKIAISVLFLLVISLLLYLFFVLYLIKLKPDNVVSRFLADFMPVPALVSSGGVVEYYDYIDKTKSLKKDLSISDPESINKFFALKFSLNSLVKKYGINFNDPDFKKKVENNILFDLDVNNVGIKRIGKIKDLINGGGNFVQISEKYGDKVGKIDFKNEEEAVNSFGDKLSGLRIDEVSDVVVHGDGYYIFKRYKKNNTFSLSYVYIPSVALDDYLNEIASKLKIWSLVD